MSRKKKMPWTRGRITNVIDNIHAQEMARMKSAIHLKAFTSFYRCLEADDMDNTTRFVTAIVKSSDDNLLLKTEDEIRTAYLRMTQLEAELKETV